MDNIKIVPWEEEVGTNEFFVPEYIENLAKQVLKDYDFSVQSKQVITTKPDKGGAIWKLTTSEGPMSLKLLHRRPTRSMFSLGAQEYLVEVKKARVPRIIKTKNQKNYVEAGGKLWFVAEWIEPLEPVTKDLAGAKLLCGALGEFHRLSKGYVPPERSEIASRLYKWPENYRKVLVKMDWFRNIARVYDDMPASSYLLSVLDQFEKQAQEGLNALSGSSYSELVKHGNQNWGLVHQDYGWSNGQKGPNGMWIIDLDGVAYDLPIRDLRKLIGGTMADLTRWDVDWIRGMIQAYHKENPISPELYEILMIDLALPNEFYKNVKEVVYEPEKFLNLETKQMMESIVNLEKTKWTVLKELQNDWKGVKQ